MWKSPLIPLSLLLLTVGSVPAQVKMEYVAHACFVIESPQGVRILIDPYNTNRWLGYHFPDQIRADAVLVSHPHYDHDANYHVSLQIPAFRQPGRFSIGDVKVQGLIGKHADQYGEDFKNINIIWVLQVDGKTFAHLGDNGPLSDRLVQDLKRADVLMVPIDSNFHILKEAEIDSIVASVKPRFLVPMHYKIPELNATMKALGPIDPWLEGRSNVIRLDENHYRFGARPDESMQILVFRPSPAAKPWSVELRQAWGAGWKGLDFLTSGEPIQATNKFNEATQMAPQVIGFWSGLATALARIDHRFGNEGDFGRPERFSESFAIDPVQVE